MSHHLFCPTCDQLIFGKDRCDCGWRLPPPAQLGERVGPPSRLGLNYIRPDDGDGTSRYQRPAYADGVLALPTLDHSVVGIELNSGQAVWRNTDLPDDSMTDCILAAPPAVGQADWFWTSATTAEGLGTLNRCVLGLHPRSGKTQWRFDTQERNLSLPALHEGVLYVLGSSKRVWAIDIASQRCVWGEPQTVRGYSREAPLVAGDLLVLPSMQSLLTALDRHTGQVRWEFLPSSGPFGLSSAQFYETPIWDGERVIATCHDNHVYALNQHDGSLAWCYPPADAAKPQRLREILAPALHLQHRGQTCVALAVKDYAPDAPKKTAHALHILNSQTGALLHRYETARAPQRAEIVTPLLAQAGVLAFGTAANEWLALDSETLALCWRVAAEAQPITPPQVHGTLAYGVSADGVLYGWRWVAPPAAALLPPEVYLARGEHEQAALAFGLAGEWVQAARLYAQPLGQHLHAAQLFAHAKAWAEAARAYEAAGQGDAAEHALKQDQPALAGLLAALLLRQGRIAEAAAVYEAAEAWLDAAIQYERAGQYAQAAALYERVDANAETLRCWQRVAAYDKLAVLYVKSQQPLAAAECYAKLGEWVAAAELFAKAGAWAQAGEAYAKVDEFGKATHAFEQGQLFERAAQMLLKEIARMGAALTNSRLFLQCYQQLAKLYLQCNPCNYSEAAQAYEKLIQYFERRDEDKHKTWCIAAAETWLLYAEQCAEPAVSQSALPISLIVQTYEKALALFDSAGSTDKVYIQKAQYCEDRSLFYAKRPKLIVTQALGDFVQGGSENLTLSLQNVGYGSAYGISIKLEGAHGGITFDTSIVIEPIKRLNSQESISDKLYTVKVAENLYGDAQVSFELSYRDFKHGKLAVKSNLIPIKVRRIGELSSPQQIIVQSGATFNQVTGDNTKIGDSVEVNRRTKIDNPQSAIVNR